MKMFHTVVVQGNAVFALVLTLLVSVIVLVLHEVWTLCLNKSGVRKTLSVEKWTR